MFDHLESIAVNMDGADRDVIVILHNQKGYDGMFILQNCYANIETSRIKSPWEPKILSLRSERLNFKDTLCFLPFPLGNFPATFRITHKFNTLENQHYEGPMPPRDPDGMSAKKNAEFERWCQEKVDENYHFVMQREM